MAVAGAACSSPGSPGARRLPPAWLFLPNVLPTTTTAAGASATSVFLGAQTRKSAPESPSVATPMTTAATA